MGSVAGDNVSDEPAADRLLRMFARFVGLGYAIYLTLLITDAISFSRFLAPWWTPVVAVSVFGSGITLALVGFRHSRRLIHRVATTAALTYLFAVFTFPIAWSGRGATVDNVIDQTNFWLTLFPGLSSLAAALVWRPIWVYAHLVVACVGAQLINSVVRGSDRSMLLADISFATMFCTLFVSAAVVAMRTGRVLDETRLRTHAAAATAAAQQARTVERERFDALIHDQVMSTLLSITQQGANSTVLDQVEHTLSQLSDLRNSSAADGDFDTAAVLAHLRLAATDADSAVAIRTAVEPTAALVVPADAARAVGAALGEAVRNSVRHAGSTADRAVDVSIRPHELRVQVVDNGKGFDVAAVPSHRLGLAVSIRTRMNQLPGGRALVESRPGHGTRVLLTWNAPR